MNPVLEELGSKTEFIKTFVRGQGNYLFDEQGREYLDFASGFGSVNFGHNHPRLVAAVRQALDLQAPGFVPSAINPGAACLSEKLIRLAPLGLEMVFFVNSGAEATEAAIKLARRTTKRRKLLSCQGSFHGKTMGALSVTSNPDYQQPFEPLLPGCHTIPYGESAVLERALASREFAAFFVEPIQGEGGMHVPPEGYLAQAQRLCRETGTLLVVDEVQTGIGRTGDCFACDHDLVTPDVMTLAKSLGGGLVPLGAMLTRRDLWHAAYGSVQNFALHTSTFGGGSLASAAGLAGLDLILEGELLENARDRGEQLIEGLQRLVTSCQYAKAVRGRGLMIGLEITPLPSSVVDHFKQANKTGLMQYMIDGLDRMVLALPALYSVQSLLYRGIYAQLARSNPLVLRVQPPLTITGEEVDRFLTAIEQILAGFELSTETVHQMISKSVAGYHEESGKSQVSGDRPLK